MCFVALLGWFVPRVTLVALWFLTSWTEVVQPWWLAILGWLLFPYTTLTYVLIHHYSGDVNTVMHLVLLLFALMVDGGTYSKSKRKRKEG